MRATSGSGGATSGATPYPRPGSVVSSPRMKSRLVAVVVAVLLLGAALLAGARGAPPLPPLGPFLDPVRGAWATARHAALPATARAEVPDLAAPVDIRYDVRGVPHIFATTEQDAIRALGWVVARDRLFQMELQARAGAGTLTELVGERAVAADHEPRRLGMARGAERQYAALAADDPARLLLSAYADGVNAWIDQASPGEWPLEYKLLATRPARWAAVNALYLTARMGWTLAYLDGERERAAAAALVGAAAANALFPQHSPLQEPIQPNGSGAARADFEVIPAPGAGDSTAAALLALLPSTGHRRGEGDESPIFASNNWAVAPSRSRSGHALLAGDPHLELTLPSIWYEVHLVVPGRLDVYGVTIPGSPGVVIGFTRDVAWSLTNTGADVMDFYRESVDDAQRPLRYMLDGAWKELELREERYRDPRGRTVRVDTVRYTHRGPLMRSGNEWLSMRWTVNEPSNLVSAFGNAARATTARGFLDVFARDYFAPALNVIVADRSGSIAIRSTGHFPIRPGDGSGLAIRDGTTSASDWQGYWPVERYPQAIDPAQGFLASANQEPIDPREGAGYIGFESAFEPWRAMRINELLRATPSATLDDMRRFQTDPGSARADLFTPYFLAAAAGGAGHRPAEAAASLRGADSVLRGWDRRYTREGVGTVLFERALGELIRRAFDELIPAGESTRVVTPSTAILAELLADSSNAWWDDRRTAEAVESRDAILNEALVAAYDSLVRQHGPPTAETWAWATVAPRRIDHLLRLPGFAVTGIPVQGGRGTLNPSTGGGAFGASWRMVVELGERVRAMGTYPGGQSGNPVSDRYADRVRLWSDGDLELLIAPPSPDSLTAAQVRAQVTLTPAGRR